MLRLFKRAKRNTLPTLSTSGKALVFPPMPTCGLVSAAGSSSSSGSCSSISSASSSDVASSTPIDRPESCPNASSSASSLGGSSSTTSTNPSTKPSPSSTLNLALATNNVPSALEPSSYLDSVAYPSSDMFGHTVFASSAELDAHLLNARQMLVRCDMWVSSVGMDEADTRLFFRNRDGYTPPRLRTTRPPPADLCSKAGIAAENALRHKHAEAEYRLSQAVLLRRRWSDEVIRLEGLQRRMACQEKMRKVKVFFSRKTSPMKAPAPKEQPKSKPKSKSKPKRLSVKTSPKPWIADALTESPGSISPTRPPLARRPATAAVSHSQPKTGSDEHQHVPGAWIPGENMAVSANIDESNAVPFGPQDRPMIEVAITPFLPFIFDTLLLTALTALTVGMMWGVVRAVRAKKRLL